MLFEFSASKSSNAFRANNVRSGTGVVSAAKRSPLRRRRRSRASLGVPAPLKSIADQVRAMTWRLLNPKP